MGLFKKQTPKAAKVEKTAAAAKVPQAKAPQEKAVKPAGKTKAKGEAKAKAKKAKKLGPHSGGFWVL